MLISLQSDKMNALWGNEIYDSRVTKWPNNCFVSEWKIYFHFLQNNIKWHTKLNNFCKRTFLDSMLSLESEKMTSLWPNDSLTFMRNDQIANQTEQLL